MKFYLGVLYARASGRCVLGLLLAMSMSIGCDCRDRDNVPAISDVTTIESSDFFNREDEFVGTMIAVENKGLPAPERRMFNSGNVYNIVIVDDSGRMYIVLSFYSGKHADKEVEALIGRRVEYPTALWITRETAGTD